MLDVNAYNGLVIAQAKKFYRRLPSAVSERLSLNDLIQAGWLGLLEAAGRYDPSHGNAFSTFAFRRINGEILDLLGGEDALTKRERKLVQEIEWATDKLKKTLGMTPTSTQIAAELSVSVKDVQRLSVEDALTEREKKLLQDIKKATAKLEKTLGTIPTSTQIAAELSVSVEDVQRLNVEDALTEREKKILQDIKKAKAKLEKTLGTIPTSTQIAAELSVSAEDVQRWDNLRVTLLSMDQLGHSADDADSQFSTWDPIAPCPPADNEVSTNQLGLDVENCMNIQLQENERQILMLRYFGGLTLVEVGQIHKTPRATLARQQKNAERKLKNCLEAKGWTVSDVIAILELDDHPNIQLDDGEGL